MIADSATSRAAIGQCNDDSNNTINKATPTTAIIITNATTTTDSTEGALLIDNEDELEKPGGLRNLPRGIEDALAICKALDR